MIRKLLHVTQNDQTKAIKDVIENSALKYEHIVLNIISVIIAILWIYQQSIPLITASMIIAPMILPIIWIALSIALKNTTLFLASLRNLWLNTLWIISVGALLTIVLRAVGEFPTEWYIANESLFYVTGLTWVVSGIAAAFILSKKSLNDALAWVAIAVSLVPPLAVSTIYLSLRDISWFASNFLTYLITIASIIIWCTLVFYLMHFSMDEQAVNNKVEKEETAS
jgi:uncharacterized membrane protein